MRYQKTHNLLRFRFRAVINDGEKMLFINSRTIASSGITLLKVFIKYTTAMAILLLLCSVACLMLPFYSGMDISNIAGFLMIAFGIYSAVMGFTFRKHNTKSFTPSLIFGIIYVGAGYGIIIRPSFGINTLSLLFFCLFIITGLNRIVMGLKDSAMTGRLLSIFIGLMDIAIAYIGINANESTNFLLTITFIGLEMLFIAWLFFSLGNSLKKA